MVIADTVIPQFWKSFYETAANIPLPTPGGEASPSPSQQNSPVRGEDSVGEQADRTAQANEEGSEYTSFTGDDHTPSNYSFNPAVSSTPAANERYQNQLDLDTTTASNASSFPTFSASLQSQKETSASFAGASDVGHDRKGKGKAKESDSTIASSISLSNVPIFSNSPSPAKGKGKMKGKAQGPLRDNVLRQMHMQAVSPAKARPKPTTPKRMKNPFRQSTVFTPHGEVVDLGRYSPSTSTTTDDSTIQLDLSPKTKLKVFSTPQYKLALRTKEEAVAIQMSEARARASDYTSSEDSFVAPPTPMTARKQAQYQRDQKAILQAQYDRDQARATTGLSLSDDDISEDNGGMSDDDSFSDDDFGGNDDTIDDEDDDTSPNRPPNLPDAFSAQPAGSHSFDTDDSFDQTFSQDDVDEYIGQPLSNLSLPSASHQQYRSAAPPLSAAKSLVSYDSTDDQGGDGDYSQAFTTDLSNEGGMERTGPTETLFGMRAADKKITEAEWQRKLSKPLPGRVLPDQPLDSPTPAETVNSKWPSASGPKGWK